MEEGKSKFDSLSEDLMVEIFLKMTENMKAMVRLRCVSKSWGRLVNSCCLPRLTCKGKLAEVDSEFELIFVSPTFKYPVNGGVVVEQPKRGVGLLLNRLFSFPLVYCISNLDTTSWVIVNGPPETGTNAVVPEQEYAFLGYYSEYCIFYISVSLRTNCYNCDRYMSYVRIYISNVDKWMFKEYRLCDTCLKRARELEMKPKKEDTELPTKG